MAVLIEHKMDRMTKTLKKKKDFSYSESFHQ